MAVVRIDHLDMSGYAKTALTSAADAGDASVSVENGSQFSSNQYVLIDGFNSPKSEIVLLSAVSGNTLTGTIAADHASSSTVQYIPYNQIVIEYSTDLSTNFETNLYTIAEAAAVSTWTELTTIDIDVTSSETTYVDNTNDTRSYRTRFLNENDGVYSPYSDAILPTGFEEFAVGAIIRKALNRTNQRITGDDSSLFDYQFMVDEINNCLREVHNLKKRWSWNQEFEYTLTEMAAGQQSYLFPRVVDIQGTNKSLLNVRTGDRKNLQYIDKREFDMKMEDAHTSQLAAELNTGSTTATFDDTSNFADSGTFLVATSGTVDTVTYTANNKDTNVLTLAATTGVTVTHAVDTDVWQETTFGEPAYFTVFEKKIHLYPIPSATYHQETIEMDFYKKLVEVDSVNDYLIFPDPMLVVHYLCMAISQRQRNYEDIDRFSAQYRERLQILRRNEVTGQRRFFTLDLNTGGYPVRGRYGKYINK